MVVKKKSNFSLFSDKKRLFFYVLVLLFIVAFVVFFSKSKDYSSFASCLADKGFVMAGTAWCPHCANQKAMFKGAFEDVLIPAGAYKDCDVQSDWCDEHDVKGYPTWFLPDGTKLEGVQKLDTLAKISGCDLP